MKKTVFIIVAILLVIAFSVSAFMVVNYVKESREQEKLRNELADLMAEAAQPTTEATQAATEPSTEATEEATVQTEPTEPTMLPELVPVYEKNQDTVGYLEIPGTKLANPVLQTPDDPHYYLKHDFNRNSSDWGAVYAWASADLNEPSDNITLFGHTMKDGSMFACLHNYTKKEYWEDNKLIIFNTLNEYHTYKIFAVFKQSANIGNFAYHQFVDAANAQEFNEFVATCKAQAFYDTGITPVYGDKLIALSTCEYTLDNGRLVVCAVRIT